MAAMDRDDKVEFGFILVGMAPRLSDGRFGCSQARAWIGEGWDDVYLTFLVWLLATIAAWHVFGIELDSMRMQPV